MNRKILVTGATGTVGKALLAQLLAAGAPVVAAMRDTAKAADIPGLDGQSAVTFDFADPGTFAGATADVDRVFLLGPPMVPALDKLLTPFIDYLKAAGITRVVYLSAMNSDKMGEALNFHAAVERKLDADGFDYTILKPTFFAQNFRNYEWDNITRFNMIYAPAGDGKVAFVDASDIAAVAAKALMEEGHAGMQYEITGPEALSFSDAAKLLTEVSGRHIAYPSPTPEEYAETLRGAGAPDFIAPYMTAVYSPVARGEAAGISDDFRRVTGKAPTALKAVLARDFA